MTNTIPSVEETVREFTQIPEWRFVSDKMRAKMGGVAIDDVIEMLRSQLTAIHTAYNEARWEEPCAGCGTHPSFWKTIVESEEWSQWEKENAKSPRFDVDESRECGWMSPDHFKAFLEFVRAERDARVVEAVQRLNGDPFTETDDFLDGYGVAKGDVLAILRNEKNV